MPEEIIIDNCAPTLAGIKTGSLFPLKTLFYLYRPGRLKKDLKDPKAQMILKSKGYSPENPDKCVAELVARLKNAETRCRALLIAVS